MLRRPFVQKWPSSWNLRRLPRSNLRAQPDSLLANLICWFVSLSALQNGPCITEDFSRCGTGSEHFPGRSAFLKLQKDDSASHATDCSPASTPQYARDPDHWTRISLLRNIQTTGCMVHRQKKTLPLNDQILKTLQNTPCLSALSTTENSS